jgi:putative hydrolase of the HAD superfamily
MIKVIALDFGGVVVKLNFQTAMRRFEEMGLPDVERYLNPFQQQGFFGDMEGGRINAEEFRQEFSRLAGREMTREECMYACMGFIESVPQYGLDTVDRLRTAGYRVVLLSNTNPYVMSWAMTSAFDGRGRGLRNYFDACYLSYACKLSKPDPDIFRFVLDNELIRPDELLFVDDGPRNVEVARSLGIQALLTPDVESWPAEVDRFLQTQQR